MKQSKITFFTSVGAGLEYYDLVIYSLLADAISKQFFPAENRVAALFATFGVFVLGNLVRPLGGVFLGMLGDKFGRKNIFAKTLLWMALITFFMGITPTFKTIGVLAPILFGLFRILQGLVFGAELPGALTFLLEHIDRKRHGLHFGFMISSVALGVSLGSFVTWILTKILTQEQITSWGFRIPFILGGGLALVGFYIRKHIPETPVFLKMKNKVKNKITKSVIKDHVKQVFNVIGILLCPASFVTFQLIFPVYLHDFYGFAYSDIYLAMTCGYIWAAITLPLFGWFSDHVGRKALLIVASILMILFVFPMFSSLNTKSCWVLFLFVVFAQTIASMMAASYFVLIPQAFQTVIRYTGTAFSYNITYTIAAIVPLVVNYIYGVINRPMFLVWIFIILGITTIVGTVKLKLRNEDLL